MATAPTEEQLAVVRSWVGAGPTDEQIEDIYLRTESFDATVEELLRTQLTDLISQPASISVPGLSISNGQNIISLQELIKKFLNSGGTGLDDPDTSPGTGTTVLVRPDYR